MDIQGDGKTNMTQQPDIGTTTQSDSANTTERQDVLGLPIALVDYEKAIELMDEMIKRRQRGYVVAAAVHALMVARSDPEMRSALDEATLVVPDGMPIVWAANLLGAELTDRVYGPELMARYCKRSAAKGHRVFLYGGHSNDALSALTDKLRARFPGIDICGSYCAPHRPLTGEEEGLIVKTLNESRADVVWVGTGAPRQEKWMHRMRDRLDAPVLIGVGAAFDFHSGRIPQAPPWMQKRGLEWLFRLSREPARLFKRYLVYNTGFMAAFARQYLSYRRRR